MTNPIDLFEINIIPVKNLGGLYTSLSYQTSSILDLSDLLRAQLVMGVSVLDSFIHSLIEYGMIEIYEKKRIPTNGYRKFIKTFKNISPELINSYDVLWFKEEIKKKHGHISFQGSYKISQHIKLISNKQLWLESEQILNISSENIKKKLDLIVDRRNKIVHDADMISTNLDERWPIDYDLVNDSICFIEKLCSCIFKIIK